MMNLVVPENIHTYTILKIWGQGGGGGGVVFGLEFLRHGGVEAWNSKGKGWGGRGDQLTTLDHQMFYFNYYTTLLLPKANLHQ